MSELQRENGDQNTGAKTHDIGDQSVWEWPCVPDQRADEQAGRSQQTDQTRQQPDRHPGFRSVVPGESTRRESRGSIAHDWRKRQTSGSCRHRPFGQLQPRPNVHVDHDPDDVEDLGLVEVVGEVVVV